MPRIPLLPPSIPRRHRRVLQRLGRWGMGVLHWNIEGEFPDVPKLVLIVAPHTSNWDFVVALFADLALDMDAAWLGKHTIFRGAFGTWLRGLGGIPVDRSAPHNVVARVVAEFGRRERMILALAPEGTRRSTGRWKSGYWQIASQAGVPILPVGLDFGRRAIVLGSLLAPSDSRDTDEAELRAFYAAMRPRHPVLQPVEQ